MLENPPSLMENVYNLGEMVHFKSFFSEIRAIKRKARAPESEVCLSAVTAPHRSIFIEGPSAAIRAFLFFLQGERACMFWLRCRLIIQARHVGHGDVGGGLGVVFDPQESKSGHVEGVFWGEMGKRRTKRFSLRGILELCSLPVAPRCSKLPRCSGCAEGCE